MNPPPKHVEKIASSLPAILLYPYKRLRKKEKRKLVRGFKVENKHEKDAIASAFFALKRIRPLINKIGQKFKQNGEENILYKEISANIILGAQNINSALKCIIKKSV